MYAKYTTSPKNRGFRASHPNIAVLPSKVIVQGKLRLLAPIQPRYLANSVSTCFTIPHVRKAHRESWKSGLSCSSSKYRRFTFFNRRVGETPISHLYLTALFGEQRFNLFHNSSCTQSTSRVLEIGAFIAASDTPPRPLAYDKYATSPRGCGLSCSSSKYRAFTVESHSVGGNQIFASIQRRNLA